MIAAAGRLCAPGSCRWGCGTGRFTAERYPSAAPAMVRIAAAIHQRLRLGNSTVSRRRARLCGGGRRWDGSGGKASGWAAGASSCRSPAGGSAAGGWPSGIPLSASSRKVMASEAGSRVPSDRRCSEASIVSMGPGFSSRNSKPGASKKRRIKSPSCSFGGRSSVRLR